MTNNEDNEDNLTSSELIDKYCDKYQNYNTFIKDLFSVRKKYHYSFFPDNYKPFIKITENINPVYRIMVICNWIINNKDIPKLNNKLNNTWRNEIVFDTQSLKISFGDIENYFLERKGI